MTAEYLTWRAGFATLPYLQLVADGVGIRRRVVHNGSSDALEIYQHLLHTGKVFRPRVLPLAAAVELRRVRQTVVVEPAAAPRGSAAAAAGSHWKPASAAAHTVVFVVGNGSQAGTGLGGVEGGEPFSYLASSVQWGLRCDDARDTGVRSRSVASGCVG